jgi:hypothetical protein
MRVGEKALIIAETDRMLAGKTPDHQRLAEHPQHRAVSEQREKDERRPERRDDRQPSRHAPLTGRRQRRRAGAERALFDRHGVGHAPVCGEGR